MQNQANSTGVNVAVVGMGYWGKNLVRNFHELGALSVICDSRESVEAENQTHYSNVRFSRDLQQPPERRTFHMAWCTAGGRVTQAVAHRAELADREIELIRLVDEHRPVYLQTTVGGEHARDLIERKARGTSERNECEALQHVAVVLTPQAAPAHRNHQTLFLVEAQRRGWNTGPLRDLANVQIMHCLTSSGLQVPLYQS